MSIALSTALAGAATANERWRAADSQASTTAAQDRRQQVRTAERSPPPAAPESQDAAAERARQRQTASNSVSGHQPSATYAFVANLRVLESQLKGSGALLDIQA